MEYDSSDGSDDEYNDVGLVEISKVLVTQDIFPMQWHQLNGYSFTHLQ